jgi:hypothetical protein
MRNSSGSNVQWKYKNFVVPLEIGFSKRSVFGGTGWVKGGEGKYFPKQFSYTIAVSQFKPALRYILTATSNVSEPDELNAKRFVCSFGNGVRNCEKIEVTRTTDFVLWPKKL